MTAMTSGYNTAYCAYQCGNSSCVKNSCVACAALCAVCAFILALNAIINSGAIISVIICVAIIIAIIGIIICNNSIRARDVYLS